MDLKIGKNRNMNFCPSLERGVTSPGLLSSQLFTGIQIHPIRTNFEEPYHQHKWFLEIDSM